MAVNRRSVILFFLTLVCVLSTAGFVHVGYTLLKGGVAFWLFVAYAVALGGIVLYFGVKIVNMRFPHTE